MYTDVNATLPILTFLSVLALLVGLAAVVQILRRGARPVFAGLVVLGAGWILGVWAYPALVQRLRVAPNALVAESPYIGHHIRLTRQAFALDRIEERDFPARESLEASDLARNATTLRNVRLWDHGPLLATFAQLQEIRTYYRFVDVDNDRYAIGDDYPRSCSRPASSPTRTCRATRRAGTPTGSGSTSTSSTRTATAW
jgi:uncharacterized membrane protein (UPF0182 family)